MALNIIQVEYFNTIIEKKITNESELISTIVSSGVDFHAFKAIPVNQHQTQFTFFAKESAKMIDGAIKSGLNLDGPYPALLIKGDEESGALGEIYKKLALEGIQVNEACGIADVNAGYGVILYLNKEDCGKAMSVLMK